VLGVILVGYLLILLDVSILMAALPHIQRDLGFSATGLSWAQNAYTLSFGGLLLLGARAGDMFGRRSMFMFGIGLFAVASLMVGLAQSPAWMIAARAAQGVGAAIIAPSTLALLSTAFPEGRERTRAMAAYGALAGIGTAAGLILGGLLTESLSWRIGFLINVPIGVAAILAAPRCLTETKRHQGKLDIASALTSTLGVSLVVYGVVRSAGAGWLDGLTLAALVVGALLVALFVHAQRRAAQPLLPLRLFADRERAGAYAGRFLFNGALLSFFFFMTQYLQGAAGYTPLQAALAFLPVTAAAVVAAAIIPRLPGRLTNSTLAILGVAAMLIGTVWLSRVSVSTGFVAGIALPMVVFGIGQGLGLSTLTNAGMAGVATRDAGAAGGVVNVAHHLGGAVGLGVLVTIFEAAGTSGDARSLLVDRVAAALDGASVLLLLALAVLIATRPRPLARSTPSKEHTCRSPAQASTPRRARPTGSPVTSTSTPWPPPPAHPRSRPRTCTSPPGHAPPGTPTRTARRSS
jgi:EmrB/QacA subfamily drug resistance transporter